VETLVSYTWIAPLHCHFPFQNSSPRMMSVELPADSGIGAVFPERSYRIFAKRLRTLPTRVLTDGTILTDTRVERRIPLIGTLIFKRRFDALSPKVLLIQRISMGYIRARFGK